MTQVAGAVHSLSCVQIEPSSLQVFVSVQLKQPSKAGVVVATIGNPNSLLQPSTPSNGKILACPLLSCVAQVAP